MNRGILLSILICLTGWHTVNGQDETCEYSVSGKIFDLETREPLPFASVQVQGTTKGASTDTTGYFEINKICQDEFDLIISFVGYKRVIHHHDVYHDLPTIYMVRDQVTLESIVVEGEQMPGELKSLALSEISGKALESSRSDNLGDVLSNISGVSTLSTGQNVVKPIIHGLHSNRVLIINNGLRHEFQNWGVEHAPEIDPSLTERIQVVKGAATVRYGPEAMGGVILIDGPALDLHEDLNGRAGVQVSSNGRAIGADIRLQKGYVHTAYLAQASYIRQGDLRAPDYMLTNTGKEERSLSFGFRYHQPEYNLTAYYSNFYQNLGILRASVAGNLDDLENAIESDEPTIIDPFSYDINNPRQEVDHNLLKIKGEWFKDQHVFELQYGFQVNHRQEYDVRRGTLNELPSIDLKLYSHTLDGAWEHPEFRGWNGNAGFQYAYQNNDNQPGTNTVAFIPNYDLHRIGLYLTEAKMFGENRWEWGLRYDLQAMDVRGRAQDNSVYTNQLSFQNASGTIGFSRNISENLNFRTNIGTAWRPPNVFELYVFGRHQSTIEYGIWRYDIDPDGNVLTDVILDEDDREVKSETGVKWISSLSWERNKFRGEVTGYVNYIGNYIFSSPGGTTSTVRGAFPFFLYDQTDAIFTGVDAAGEWRHSQYWNSQLKMSYVYARDVKNKSWFLEIPPLRFDYQMNYKPSIVFLPNSEIGLSVAYVFNQWNAPPVIPISEVQDAQESGNAVYQPGSTFDFTNPPDAYFLVNASFSGGWRKIDYRLDIRNVLNSSYRMYTNRLRYFADEPGINFRISFSYSF